MYSYIYTKTYFTGMNFWYKDPLADSNTCDKIAYNDGGTFSSSEDCNTKLPYMCEVKGKVETGKYDFCQTQIKSQKVLKRIL